MNYYIAVDIGASSGRHIVGWKENGEIRTDEVYRFPNGVKSEDGHLVWDTEALLGHIKTGIEEARKKYKNIRSLAIDTWGVDYVLLRGDEPVMPVYAYRDGRTAEAIERVHGIIPFAELYRRTGCQFQTFTSIYQLYADKMAGRLEGVTDFLMLPEYFSYRLCGVKAKEYTDATTTGLMDAASGRFDMEIITALGFPKDLFTDTVQPGTCIGSYEGIDVILCATHDTASAVEGIPMTEDAPYISSGTWSLMGVKTAAPVLSEQAAAANWSNEGGVGYNRFQKNIMGMWIINELRRELCPDAPFGTIVDEAKASNCRVILSVNSPEFFSPESMKTVFDKKSGHLLQTPGDYFKCAYRSLADCYSTALDELGQLLSRSFGKIYIVGGGAKNTFLNDLTAEATGKQVIALPIEATALGNLKVQMHSEEEK